MIKPLGTELFFPAAKSSTYLDSASIALMHKDVALAGNDWTTRLAEMGTDEFSEQDELDIFDNLQNSAAKIFGADPKDIVGSSSETILMSSVAWGVMPEKGTNIVGTTCCHPSTIYPWMRVAQHTGAEMRWIQDEDYYIDPEKIIEAIDDNTSVVCLSHVEYSTGQQYDLAAITKVAHQHGAIVVVDATQSAGQVPIDAVASNVDMIAASTYKWLCGPFGTGLMYISPRLQNINPGIIGWRSHEDMWDFQADRLVLPKSAKRFEFGTISYGSARGVTESLEYLGTTIGIDSIADHNTQVSNLLREGLRERGHQIIGPTKPEECSAIVAARFGNINASDVARYLKENGVITSLRKDFVRFSPHLFNGSHDIDRALQVIDKACTTLK